MCSSCSDALGSWNSSGKLNMQTGFRVWKTLEWKMWPSIIEAVVWFKPLPDFLYFYTAHSGFISYLCSSFSNNFLSNLYHEKLNTKFFNVEDLKIDILCFGTRIGRGKGKLPLLELQNISPSESCLDAYIIWQLHSSCLCTSAQIKIPTSQCVCFLEAFS